MLAALLGNPLPLVLGVIHRTWKFGGTVAGKINLQGWIGIAAALFLSLHFGGDARHWRKLYGNEHRGRVLAELRLKTAEQSIANLRTASLAAQDENRSRVAADTAAREKVNKETNDDFQADRTRLRTDYAQRMRNRSAAAQGVAGGNDLSALPAPATGPDGEAVQGAAPDLLDAAETELQLNALIDWVAKQHAIDPNKEPTR